MLRIQRLATSVNGNRCLEQKNLRKENDKKSIQWKWATGLFYFKKYFVILCVTVILTSKRRSFKHCCFLNPGIHFLVTLIYVRVSVSSCILQLRHERMGQQFWETVFNITEFKVCQPRFFCTTNDTSQCHYDIMTFTSDFTWMQQLSDDSKVNKENYDPEVCSVSQSMVLIILWLQSYYGPFS